MLPDPTPPTPPVDRNRVVAHLWIPKNASWCVAEGIVVVPHVFLRSALFAGVSTGSSPVRSKPTPVPLPRGFLLKQISGPQLTQHDADPYFSLLQLALDQPSPAAEGDPVQLSINAAALLRQCGISVGDGSGPRRRQVKHLERLDSTEIQLTRDGDTIYCGPLLHYEPSPGPGLRIALPGGLGALFAGGTYTRLKLDIRQKLSPLARWLHGYFCSHSIKTIQPHGLRTVLQLAGRAGQRTDKSAAALAQAVDELAEHQAQLGWTIKINGNYVVVTDPSAPRRVAKLGAKPPRRAGRSALNLGAGALDDLLSDSLDDDRRANAFDGDDLEDFRPPADYADI